MNANEAPKRLPPITSVVQCSPKETRDNKIIKSRIQIPERTNNLPILGSFFI